MFAKRRLQGVYRLTRFVNVQEKLPNKHASRLVYFVTPYFFVLTSDRKIQECGTFLPLFFYSSLPYSFAERPVNTWICIWVYD